MNDHTKKKSWRWLAVAVWIAVIVILFVNRGDMTAGEILKYTPENPLTAAVVMLMLFALKGATIVFPIGVLETVVGHLFSTPVALIVNLFGISLVLTVPYWMRRLAGLEAVRKLMGKYPKFGKILSYQLGSLFFISFFLRIVGGLPGEVVTMYLGATGVGYWENLLGGILGIGHRMILYTLFGSSIEEPGSPIFWVSIGLMAALSVCACILYALYLRHAERKKQNV